MTTVQLLLPPSTDHNYLFPNKLSYHLLLVSRFNDCFLFFCLPNHDFKNWKDLIHYHVKTDICPIHFYLSFSIHLITSSVRFFCLVRCSWLSLSVNSSADCCILFTEGGYFCIIYQNWHCWFSEGVPFEICCVAVRNILLNAT